MRFFRLLAALALALAGSLTATASDAEAPGTGQLAVAVLDMSGSPALGSIQVLDSTGNSVASAPGVTSRTFELAPGTYAVVVATPWGGFMCAGLNPCDYNGILLRTVLANGSLTVSAGNTRTVTVQEQPPAEVVGTPQVGSTLVIAYSESLRQLLNVLAGGGGTARPTVEWLRDGTPIAGATGETYVPTGADAGRGIAARLSYTGVGLTYMMQLTGGTPIPPVTTSPVSATKRPTKAYVRMIRDHITVRQRGVVRVDVTAPNTIVTGKVKVTVGDWTQTRPLRNGRVAVQLPALGPGRYVVHATYLGTAAYKPAEAKAKTLTVTT